MNLKNQTADLEAKSTLKKLLWLMEAMPEIEQTEIIDEILVWHMQHSQYPCDCIFHLR